MTKFIIKIKMANGNSKQVKVYVDNRTEELLNQCDARVSMAYSLSVSIPRSCHSSVNFLRA